MSSILRATTLASLSLSVCLICLAVHAQSSPAESPDELWPAYDSAGRLLLPSGYEGWILAGSSLGLSYSEGGGGHEMFHHTLIEPSAYRHFTETGEFRDGTMLALLLHDTGEGVLPQRRGRFAAEVMALEMAVKDSRQGNELWSYYGFGSADGFRNEAEAFASQNCFQCHAEHAAHDNVFLQFYPLLAGAAPDSASFRTTLAATDLATNDAPAEAPPEEETVVLPLALKGLDPVLLTEGREELGKPEILESFGPYSYQFTSEPTRARFAADPERFAVQNETCPVVPGAAVSPNLFAIHQGRIFLFASANCVTDFLQDPAAYLGGEPTS